RVAQAELQDARENQNLARLDHRHAVDLLNLRTLRSPFDGVVMDRMLNPGDLTQYGTETKPIVKLAQIDPLRVEVVLPVEYYRRLSLGMTGEVAPEGLGAQHTATVKVIDRVFDAASGTFGVRLESLYNRGSVLQSLGQHDRALESYDRALALQPGDAEALNNRGVALNELGRHAEALQSFDLALAVRPEYAEALNNRGNALQALGRHG